MSEKYLSSFKLTFGLGRNVENNNTRQVLREIKSLMKNPSTQLHIRGRRFFISVTAPKNKPIPESALNQLIHKFPRWFRKLDDERYVSQSD